MHRWPRRRQYRQLHQPRRGFIYDYGSLPQLRSFLRDPSGHIRNIGTLPGEDPVTQAEALNNRNQIVGGFGSTPNYAQAINDRGQVTGNCAPLQRGRIHQQPRHVVGSSSHLAGFVYRDRKMEA